MKLARTDGPWPGSAAVVLSDLIRPNVLSGGPGHSKCFARVHLVATHSILIRSIGELGRGDGR